MADVLVVGSANMDLVVRSPRFPAAGETLLGSEFATYPGGKGANQAVAIAKLGGAVRFCGRLGKDAFGDQLRESLRSAGVDVSHATAGEAPSGVALITVDDHGENTIVVAPGANSELCPADVFRALSAPRVPSVLLVQLEVPLSAVHAALQGAAEQGMKTILNPAPMREMPNDLLQLVQVLTPNQSEAEALTGITVSDQASRERAAETLHERGVREVVITCGAEGCFYSGPAGTVQVATPRVDPVDTTAAGDAFNGALALSLAQGKPLREGLRFANRVAAFSTTRPGAQSSMPTLAELPN